MHNTYIWNTRAIIKETNDAVTIVFDTKGMPFLYLPGQFVNVTLTIAGEPVTRSYSLSTVPGIDAHPAITVKRVRGGIMSNYIADRVNEITSWNISGPYGSFVFPDHATDTKHLVLLTGGSGITPLFSIARSFISRFPEAIVTLVYSSRTAADIIFKERIMEWAAQYPGRIHVHHALSEPGDDTAIGNATLIRGRMNKLVARKLIKMPAVDPLVDTCYFICGPSGLMTMHQEMLEAMQVPAENVYLEWFAPLNDAAAAVLPENQQDVLLHFYEQSNLLEVLPGKSILDAALEDRIPLPYSCKAGTCGICAARLIAGKVTMANNYALRQSDLDDGLVLLCQSYPLTDDVTVEIAE
ncbi:2Fe-2S iron-sulfur cluster-binding protein [Chitinophaga sp. 22321]|uniref:2Fe-2S iron-sulfur cluster binding domain-containing protein n=1 Tax=Chitinophaga hostae TaxID=2831022 RepID=A0ABS5J6I3_9BACT|nr:ferredoxin--NADP reductase [Chitinophaga hostae]MBS0030057.1 2Fe-2S iron-sulfur cluster binding domain-containing protein [Chitinophaga hostae]